MNKASTQCTNAVKLYNLGSNELINKLRTLSSSMSLEDDWSIRRTIEREMEIVIKSLEKVIDQNSDDGK